METRAPYIIVGAFVLAAIAAVFGFVYWLNNAGGIGKRDNYQLVFNGPVPGLLVGAGVLFNGSEWARSPRSSSSPTVRTTSAQRSRLRSIRRCAPIPESDLTFRG